MTDTASRTTGPMNGPGSVHHGFPAATDHPPVDPGAAPPVPSGPTGGSGRWAQLVRGPRDQPAWVRPALWGLLAATAVLYLWNLTASGDANDFYAAAVKSGTESWKALLFGSLDSSNAITVDKPPASIWIMALSGRLLGFSSFSMLLPQALMGVATVYLVYAGVKRFSGPRTGLIAGGLVAITPVAALMFTFNNPDALLVLLMTGGLYAVVRAIECDRDRARSALQWLLLAGVLIGFAFLTKMLQGLLILPAMAGAYLLAGQPKLWTRIWHLLAAGVAVIVSAGWFVLLVALWPADSRPYIGGSETNSLWELALGYNGLGRIFGGDGNGGGGGTAAATGTTGGFGGGGGGFGGATGITRLFNTQFGSEISWLLPAALIGLLAGLWFTRRYPRTDRIRAALVLWGGSLVVTALVFSFMEGTIHQYYTVAMVPALAATLAISARELWRGRGSLIVRSILALMIAVTGVWSFVLLGRADGWLPWLRWVVLIGALVGAALLVASTTALKRLAVIGVLVGSLSALGGTTAWALATTGHGHTGSIPTSGPSGYSSGMGGGPGGAGMTGGAGPTDGGFGRRSGDGRSDGSGSASGGSASEGTDGAGAPSGQTDGTGATGMTPPEGMTLPEGMAAPDGTDGSGQTGMQPPSGTGATDATGSPDGTGTAGTASGGTSTGGAGGGFGGGGQTADSELVALLNATTSRWSAATIGSQSAATYILNTDTAVMAIGGFTGSDPSPTLAQFQQYVADGDIHYFIAGGGMGGRGGGSGSASEISSWVEAHFTAQTVGGTTVYDLTQPTSSTS